MFDEKEYMKEWHKANRKKCAKKSPWYSHFISARGRCYPSGKYFKRGIKFFLTKEDAKFLWFRDGASKLKEPSIDRIDNKGNYELSNCRFIELEENRKPKPVLQFSKNGDLIREYKSYGEVVRIFKKRNPKICDVANGKIGCFTAMGYVWRWKSELGNCRKIPKVGFVIHNKGKKLVNGRFI